MPFISHQEAFACEHCGADVAPLEHGSCRNHCPKCLWSKHVDDLGPGDRASLCQGPMEPVGLDQKRGHWVVLHRCTRCGKSLPNKAAPDDDLLAWQRPNE